MDLSVLTTQQQSLFIFLVAMAGIMVVAVFFMWAKGWRKGSERLDPPPRFKDVSSKKTEASKFSETEDLTTEVSKAELSKSTESKFSKKLSQIFSVSKKIVLVP
jgi:hypothetical protein